MVGLALVGTEVLLDGILVRAAMLVSLLTVPRVTSIVTELSMNLYMLLTVTE